MNGEVIIHKGLSRERPSYRASPVSCPRKLLQVHAYRNVVWALSQDGHIMVRVGVTVDRSEGTDWKFLQG